jgi:hypothetical protein
LNQQAKSITNKASLLRSYTKLNPVHSRTSPCIAATTPDLRKEKDITVHINAEPLMHYSNE